MLSLDANCSLSAPRDHAAWAELTRRAVLDGMRKSKKSRGGASLAASPQPSPDERKGTRAARRTPSWPGPLEPRGADDAPWPAAKLPPRAVSFALQHNL